MLTARIQPSTRVLPETEEDELNRYCIVLALLEEVYRAGLNPASPLAQLPKVNVELLLNIAKKPWLDDLKTLSWRFFEECHHLVMLPHKLNPTFEGSHHVGGADADLIVQDTLIEIKTTIRAEIKQNWLWQLLGYALLDYSDQHHIEGIGLYMARQGWLVKWDLAEAIRGLFLGSCT